MYGELEMDDSTGSALNGKRHHADEQGTVHAASNNSFWHTDGLWLAPAICFSLLLINNVCILILERYQ